MAIISAVQPKFISLKNDGSPNSLGTIGFYTAGTSFASGNEITIWDSFTKDSTLTNPVTLDSDGTKEVWFDVKCDIEELDSSGNALANGQTLAVDPNISTTSTGNFNQVKNGSFEVGTTVPDNWTLSTESGGTIAIDSTSGGQAHGDNGLKFTGTTSGAGTATSDFFPVLTSGGCEVKFTYKSSISTVTNSITIFWYQFDDSASSPASTVVYTATSGHPSTFTDYVRRVAVPSNAVKAKIELLGVGSSGSTVVGPTWFDDIQVINHSDTEHVIYDSNGNEVIKTGATASAVNEITITNAATGNSPTISTSGEADIGIYFENDQGEELLELIPVATAVNNVRITNATTGNAAKIDVSETNSDLDFPRNGTGDITVDSTPIYGLVVLNTPVLLLTDATTSATSNTPVDLSAHGSITGTAVKVILNVIISLNGSSGTGFNEVLVGEGGETLTTGVHRAVAVNPNGTDNDDDSNQVTINLAAGEIFDYSIAISGNPATSRTVTIHLAGYYV